MYKFNYELFNTSTNSSYSYIYIYIFSYLYLLCPDDIAGIEHLNFYTEKYEQPSIIRNHTGFYLTKDLCSVPDLNRGNTISLSLHACYTRVQQFNILP